MNTIRCRIALSITPEGKWEANGAEVFGGEGADHRDFFGGNRRPAGTVDYWINVDIPVPEIETIRAVASEADWGPLPDALVELRDKAIDDCRAGLTEEFTSMGE